MAYWSIKVWSSGHDTTEHPWVGKGVPAAGTLDKCPLLLTQSALPGGQQPKQGMHGTQAVRPFTCCLGTKAGGCRKQVCGPDHRKQTSLTLQACRTIPASQKDHSHAQLISMLRHCCAGCKPVRSVQLCMQHCCQGVGFGLAPRAAQCTARKRPGCRRLLEQQAN